jgi:hypothetical protein
MVSRFENKLSRGIDEIIKNTKNKDKIDIMEPSINIIIPEKHFETFTELQEFIFKHQINIKSHIFSFNDKKYNIFEYIFATQNCISYLNTVIKYYKTPKLLFAAAKYNPNEDLINKLYDIFIEDLDKIKKIKFIKKIIFNKGPEYIIRKHMALLTCFKSKHFYVILLYTVKKTNIEVLKKLFELYKLYTSNLINDIITFDDKNDYELFKMMIKKYNYTDFVEVVTTLILYDFSDVKIRDLIFILMDKKDINDVKNYMKFIICNFKVKLSYLLMNSKFIDFILVKNVELFDILISSFIEKSKYKILHILFEDYVDFSTFKEYITKYKDYSKII